VSEPYPLGRPTDPVERFQKHHFYWLHCRRPVDRMVVRADRKGNTIDVTVERVDPAELSVLLRPEMFDPSQDVVVRVQGEEVWRGRPAPSFATVVDTLDAKLDRTLVFDRRVPLGRE